MYVYTDTEDILAEETAKKIEEGQAYVKPNGETLELQEVNKK